MDNIRPEIKVLFAILYWREEWEYSAWNQRTFCPEQLWRIRFMKKMKISLLLKGSLRSWWSGGMSFVRLVSSLLPSCAWNKRKLRIFPFPVSLYPSTDRYLSIFFLCPSLPFLIPPLAWSRSRGLFASRSVPYVGHRGVRRRCWHKQRKRRMWRCPVETRSVRAGQMTDELMSSIIHSLDVPQWPRSVRRSPSIIHSFLHDGCGYRWLLTTLA